MIMWLYYYVIKCGNLTSYDESVSFYDDRYHFNLRVYWIIIINNNYCYIGGKIECIQWHVARTHCTSILYFSLRWSGGARLLHDPTEYTIQ